MNFDAFSGNRRSRRLTSPGHTPAMIESLESRALLAAAGPSIISPTGTISTSLPFITWQATPNATSYDLWIADSEARERIVFKEGIPGNSTTLAGGDRLRLGGNRMWVRATLADGSKTEWGTPADVVLKARPVVVGPTNPANPAAPNRIETNDWAVTWNSPNGATKFEVFVSDQTQQTSKFFTVPNQTQVLDANGNAILDGAGNPILQEVRSLYLDGAVDVIGAAPQVVSNAVNRSYIDITSDNHGLVTGDKVRVSGVLGNTGANGDYTVTVISENVFRLNNAVNTGTYTSGGNWVRLVGNAPAAGMSQRLISGVTKSTAIDLVVTNHGLRTGDKVRISGVGGNTAANGTFFVTVLNANTIQLRGITGTSVFTQNGQLVRLTQFQSKLELGRYRIFVRSTDDGGRVSPWSVGRDIEITPVVNVVRPQGPTFESQPLLQWEAVPGATHYQVEVYGPDVRVTSVNHGLVTGDTVRVFGVRGLAGANGDFTVTVLSKDLFRLDGAVGSGVYTNGGSWQKLVNKVAGASKTITGVTLQKDTVTPIYSAGYVVDTSYRIPYSILRSAPVISVQGNPTSGTYSIEFEIYGAQVVRRQTALLPYNATAAQIKAAINAIAGLESFDVVEEQKSPFTSYRIVIPADFDLVKTSVVETVDPGTVLAATTPVAINAQEFDFRVRAFRLHQVTRITPSGSPASGTFVISLTTNSKTPVSVQTAPLNYNATAADIQAAVRVLTGFEKATVVAQGNAPNTVFLLQLPLTGNVANPGAIGGNPVKVSVISSVTPGTVTSSTTVSPRVDSQWSPLVRFTSIQKPVITAPLGVDTPDPAAPRTITDLRPTLKWTAIDKAARYEIWVERLASTSTYLRTNSSVNSYTFEADLLSGKYTVRVRAVSATGQFTEWSELYAFTSTGGATIVQSVTVAPTRQATITWAAVAEADSYEVQIARIGTNIDFLHPTGITVTKYTTTQALPVGNYRVWVRGVKADGTFLNWSQPVDFVVVEANSLEAADPEGKLVALVTSELSAQDADASRQTEQTLDIPAESQPDESASAPIADADEAIVVSPESVPAYYESSPASEEDSLIERLAQACHQQEWWTIADKTSA